jgi:SAM-dependent methyltransferase
VTGVPFSRCPVCGGRDFTFSEVLWPELIREWELSADEVRYVNRQQGLLCEGCGNNLRSMALAGAILDSYRGPDTLIGAIRRPGFADLRILELNEAGGLTRTLSESANHRCLRFPEVDLMSLDLPDSEFDLVVHSDTLEHVPDPVRALGECRRVLRPGGRCIFTVPVVVGRLSRSREGRKASYHGERDSNRPDLRVHTEFGADVWTSVLRAGFRACTIHAVEFPAGLALVAER